MVLVLDFTGGDTILLFCKYPEICIAHKWKRRRDSADIYYDHSELPMGRFWLPVNEKATNSFGPRLSMFE
jgi:hypothetical protein